MIIIEEVEFMIIWLWFNVSWSKYISYLSIFLIFKGFLYLKGFQSTMTTNPDESFAANSDRVDAEAAIVREVIKGTVELSVKKESDLLPGNLVFTLSLHLFL